MRENCRIGNNVLLQNGVVIGADGFGFAKTADGRWHKIPQPAPVVIEDDVEVQANSCIDRASVGETRIERGVKVDNLVQVGHGSHVGQDALLCSQVGLGGIYRDWKSRHPDGPGRRGRPLQGWRRCDRHAAERRRARYSCEGAGEWRSGGRSQSMAEVFGDPAALARDCPGCAQDQQQRLNTEATADLTGTTLTPAPLGTLRFLQRRGPADILLAGRCQLRHGPFPSNIRGCQNLSVRSGRGKSLRLDRAL